VREPGTVAVSGRRGTGGNSEFRILNSEFDLRDLRFSMQASGMTSGTDPASFEATPGQARTREHNSQDARKAVQKEASMPSGKLLRSRTNKILGGVCGGIAEWLGWNPTMVRVLYVIFSILSVAFPGALVYIILWFVMPKASA
jgi:phage shock protein PspC (stress-responsive transcriptional regulator)